MHTIFCLVLTFNHIANKFFLNLKDIICIKRETLSKPLILAYIKPHNCDQDSNKDDTKILPLSPFSSKVCLPAFVQLAYDIDNIFCKLFVALPA